LKNEKQKILVIDDEKANCLLMAQILKNDYTVYVSTNSSEALEVIKRNTPDVILLDIIMPELDGYEVLKILKANPATEKIPVIFITGLNNEEDYIKGLELGADDFIGKPFSPTIVKLRLKKTLQTNIVQGGSK